MHQRPYITSLRHRALLIIVRLDAWWLVWLTLGQMAGLGVVAWAVLQVVGQVVKPEHVAGVTDWCQFTLSGCGGSVASAVMLQLFIMAARYGARRELDYLMDERLDGSHPNYD